MKKMSETIVILAPHKRQREECDDQILKLRRSENLTTSDVLRTATVDSSWGYKADIGV